MIKNNIEIYLCAINNIESGTCNEDCKFCTQSVKYNANISRYKRKNIQDIVTEAKKAKENKAIGYCLVTAGAGLDDKRLEFVCQAASAVKKAVPDISLIACNGIASLEQLKELKDAGIDNYNHNLESSKEFYPTICSTHSWEDRFQTCLNVKQSGLNLCSGGIFGMGESDDDRVSLMNSIKELNPMSIPMNFFHPNEALPLSQNKIAKKTAFALISKMRGMMPETMIMVAGGREITFQEEQYDIFKYGANSIVIGDYLTTSGQNASQDLINLEKLGFEIAKNCDRS